VCQSLLCIDAGVAAMTNKVVRSLSEIHDTLRALEDGSSLTRYLRNKRPETRMFRVLLETRELVWMRTAGNKAEGVGMFCDSVVIFMCISTINNKQ